MCFTLLPTHHSRSECKCELVVRLLHRQWQNGSGTLTVPFLSIVTRRSCLLCEWVQLITGSASPSSVVPWPTVRIWTWPSSCWKARPSIAAEPQRHKEEQRPSELPLYVIYVNIKLGVKSKPAWANVITFIQPGCHLGALFPHSYALSHYFAVLTI